MSTYSPSIARAMRLHERPERGPHLLHRAEDRVLRRVRLQVERAANLLDRTTVVVPHQKRRPLLFAQVRSAPAAPARRSARRTPGPRSIGPVGPRRQPVEHFGRCADSRCGRLRRWSIAQLNPIRYSQVPKFDRDSKRASCRYARTNVSWTTSSASSGRAGHAIGQPIDTAAMALDQDAERVLIAARRLGDGGRVVQMHLVH